MDNYVKDKRKEFETELSESERKNDINQCVSPVDANDYLSFTASELEKMSAHECAIAKYAINQHALAIQRSLNRSIAVKNWASRNLEITSSKDIIYDGTFFKYEVVRDKFIMTNSYAKELNDIIIEEQGKIDSLSFITQHLKEMGSALSNLSYSKKELHV